MEDVLDLYAEPYQEKRPLICYDEKPYQLLANVHEPLLSKPNKPRREDYEYQRKGNCNLFIQFEPLKGERTVTVREQRTSREFALEMKALVTRYPEAEVIRVVLDNLSTHSPAALYQTFPAEEARCLTQKLEFHYTPKHASWLNMAEIEWSALERQCLKRRIADTVSLEQEVKAWEEQRNQHQVTVNWRFTTAHARTKLARLYPRLSQ